MYYIQKTFEVSACHHLELDYESKCTGLHGHNWLITVFCKAKELDRNGMVCDFSEIKKAIHGYMDHGNLNTLFKFNPTAENIAHWCTEQIPECYKATVQESEGNIATYVVDEED